MEFTPIEKVTAGSIGSRPRRWGSDTRSVDGNDIWAVREAPARRSSTPARAPARRFVETLTYRFVGHSRSDPGKYRKPGELERMAKRDPLILARGACSRSATGPARALDEIDAEVAQAELEQVGRARLAAPFPDPATGRGVQVSGSEIEYRAAVRAAIDEEMERDERSSSSARTWRRPAACSR